MAIFISLLIVIAFIFIFTAIAGSSKVIKVQIPKEELNQVKKPFVSSLFPFSQISQRLLERFNLDVKIKNRLDAAHLRLTVQGFINLKLALAISLGILTFLILGKLNFFILVGVSLGYILPELWLRRRIAQRKYLIGRVLPETIDLLGLCIEAGLDFATAIRWIIEKKAFTNPLVEELAFVLEEITWGKSRNQALKDMARRLNISEINSFVNTLIQAERMGTPVTEAFAILSEDARSQRFHQGERFAMQAPIKILIPLIFCIFPVIAIVVAGPIILQFTQGHLLRGF